MPQNIHTIVLYPKPQSDTIAAVFLLKKFGEEKFPGIKTAKFEFWAEIPKNKNAEELEKNGYLLLDLRGQFDHHKELNEFGKPRYCLSEIVAKFLGVENNSALKKLIAFARRCDLEGKGIISEDSLDKAFGLSGIIMNLNRTYSNNLEKVVNIILEIFEAHYQEEEKRTKSMKEEWKELKKSKNTKEFFARHKRKSLRIVLIHSDNTSLPGFLRAYVGFDIVIIRLSSGHLNIITKQSQKIDLLKVVEKIRQAELEKKGEWINLPSIEWQKSGRFENIEEWFYDTAANTLQNGGISPQGISPTKLADEEICKLVKLGLEFY